LEQELAKGIRRDGVGPLVWMVVSGCGPQLLLVVQPVGGQQVEDRDSALLKEGRQLRMDIRKRVFGTASDNGWCDVSSATWRESIRGRWLVSTTVEELRQEA